MEQGLFSLAVADDLLDVHLELNSALRRLSLGFSYYENKTWPLEILLEYMQILTFRGSLKRTPQYHTLHVDVMCGIRVG